MRLSQLLIILSLATAASKSIAQTGPGAGDSDGLTLSISSESPTTFEASWWGRSGRTYYLLHSSDLITWEYFPTIETGQNATIRYGFSSESPRIFIRLRYEDEVYNDPFSLDSDGDGLTNEQELILKTDPFNADSDGDGLLDKWEIDHGFDPRDASTGLDTDGDHIPDVWENIYFGTLARDGTGDYDGDTITDRQEYIMGTAPNNAAQMSTSIGLTVLEP